MALTATYLTTEELASRIKYDTRYIRETLKDSVFLEGIHYIRPFGRRRILYIWEAIEYIWEAIERDMCRSLGDLAPVIALTAGTQTRA